MKPGNRDTDSIILSKLNDKDLLSMCNSSKYFNSLCDNSFFLNRIKSIYPNIILFKPVDLSWRKYYLQSVYYIDKMLKDYKFKYSNVSNGSPKDYYEILDNYSLKFNIWKEVSYKKYKDMIHYLINRYPDNFREIIKYSEEAGNNELVKELIDKYGVPK